MMWCSSAFTKEEAEYYTGFEMRCMAYSPIASGARLSPSALQFHMKNQTHWEYVRRGTGMPLLLERMQRSTFERSCMCVSLWIHPHSADWASFPLQEDALKPRAGIIGAI